MDAVPSPLEPEALLRDVGWVQSLSRQLVRDAALAEEVAQETWLAALGRAWPAGTPPRRWLAHVARNVARSRARASARGRDRERAVGTEPERSVPTPEELLARMETQRKLAEAVLALEEPYRTTILLRYVEGLEPAEIARRQGVPAPTVRSRAARGLEMLREDLDRRSRGDRREWFAALVAIAGSSQVKSAAAAAGGAFFVKWIAGSALVLVAAVSIWFFTRTDAPQAPDTPVAAAPTTSTPLVRETPAQPALREPEHADARAGVPAPPVASADKELFACRLVDELTGEPVPHFSATLVAPDGAREDVESDERGHVRGAKTSALAAVTIDLALARHPSDIVQTKPDASKAVPASVIVEPPAQRTATPIDVKIPVGPTYTFTMSLPAGRAASDFTATLMSADPSQAFDKLYAKLSDGERTWVRFSPLARAMSGGPTWKVHLGSDDGLWAGSAEIDRIQGIVSPPLVILLASTGRVRGRVTDAEGKIMGSEYVQMWRPGSSFSDPKNRPLLVPTNKEGRYDARHVPPGPYDVKMSVKLHDDFAGHVDVLGGGTQDYDIVMVPMKRDGSLTVRVTSTTGKWAGEAKVTITSTTGVRSLSSKPVEWTLLGGAQVGQVRFADIPRAPHEFEVLVKDGTPVTPHKIAAETDGSQIEFVVHDETPMRELVFDVRDADTNETVVAKTFLVLMPGSDPAVPRYALVDKAKQTTRVPDAVGYDVTVRADGYRPVQTHIERPVDAAPIALKMKKGWGIEVRCVDASNKPLSGVHVELDGVEVGLTDANGKLALEQDAVPTAMKARLDGWRSTKASDPDPETGRFRAWQPWARIVMEPVSR